ncbi:phage protease [Bosea vestrisii]|uniref:Phage protease n=1 Tax=Bosea vestrisii TaxID=151416 RepID=A0ABW0H9X2_9HYPH
MKTIVSSLHFQIPATGEVPEWVHLTPVGTFSGVDGRGPFRLEDAAAVIADSLSAGKLPIDENHATDTAAPEGRPSPARGWIVAMEARSDGIWGKVEWTNAGRELLADKAYRGISPVLLSTKAEGRVLKILRAALTNDPNLNLTSLHSRSEPMEFVAKLRQALGLKDDAAEDAVLAAATSAHAAVAGRADDLKRFAEAAGLAAATSADQVVTHLNATRSAGGDAVTLRQTVVDLQSRLDTVTAERSKDKATQAVDAAIAAGKPIVAMRDHYIERHQKDPAGVDKELAALPSINSGGIVTPPKDAPLAAGTSAAEIIAKAEAHRAEQAKNGITISSTDAILFVSGRS